MTEPDSTEKSLLEHISTHWTMIADPAKFVLRYAPAIRKYLNAILKGSQDTDDVAQDFLMRVMTRGFSEKQVTRGRFRDFLRVAVRNAAIDHLRVKKPAAIDQQILEETVAARADNDWIGYWRMCLLDKAWQKLDQYQRATPGNLYHTVLKLTTDFPDEDSQKLAERATQATNHPLRADAFRQQLHRARRKFAELVVAEIKETLRSHDESELQDELRELGLITFVEDYID